MKRYYISNIIGNGDIDAPNTDTTGPYRPAVADHGVSWVGSIPSDPDTGKPLHTWALVLVEATNHAALMADKRIDRLPDFPLDGKVNAINYVTRQNMLAAMAKRGIDIQFVANSDGFRDVVRGIGRAADPSFDENNFDIQ